MSIRFLHQRPVVILLLLQLLLILTLNQINWRLLNPKNKATSLSQFKTDAPLLCEGVVTQLVLRNEALSRVSVFLKSCLSGDQMVSVRGVARLSVAGVVAGIQKGNLVRFQSKLRVPHGFANPGGFDFEKHAAIKGIDWIGFLERPEWIRAIDQSKDSFLARHIDWARGRIESALKNIPENEKQILTAITLGDQTQIDEGLLESYRDAGIVHLLVVSGLHVGFIALILFSLFQFGFRFSKRILLGGHLFSLASFLTLICIWPIIFVMGNQIPAMRAGFTTSLFLMSIMFKRRHDTLTLLSVAVILILINQPLALFDVSFQLSVTAVIGIALTMSRFLGENQKAVSLVDKGIRYIRVTVYMSIAATLSVAPILLYHFKETTVIGIVSNLFFIPLFGFIILPISLLGMGISLLSTSSAATLFGWGGGFVSAATPLVESIAKIGSWFKIEYVPSLLDMTTYYLLVALLFIPLKLKRLISVSALLIFFIIKGVIYFENRESLRVTFLDIGQGSAIVAEFPNGHVMVIDAPGNPKSQFDRGEMVIAPFLYTRGIRKINTLVVTHSDTDHYLGLPYIVDHFSPDIVWMGESRPRPESAELWEAFIDQIQTKGIPIQHVAADHETLNIGDATIQLLGPPTTPPSDWNANNQSIVVMISFEGKRILLTGDLEKEGEAWMKNTLVDVDVMGVPHHGSQTSSTQAFLDVTRPEYVVAQVGFKNQFRHPHFKIVNRYEKSGSHFFRTDRDGAIDVKIKKGVLKIESFRKN